MRCVLSEASIYGRVCWEHGGYSICIHGSSQLRSFCALLSSAGMEARSPALCFLSSSLYILLVTICLVSDRIALA